MNAGAPLQSHTGEPGDSPLLPTPREMVAAMDRTVVGQVHAKRGLATAVYEHYVRDGMRAGGTSSRRARTCSACMDRAVAARANS